MIRNLNGIRSDSFKRGRKLFVFQCSKAIYHTLGLSGETVFLVYKILVVEESNLLKA